MSERNRPIPESYWVEPGRFLAGEYPGHAFGEQLRQRLDAFLDFGIDTFIDLTDPDELPSYLPVLEEQAGYYGIDLHYKRFTITDHSVPPPAAMQAILDEIDSSLAAGRKVYVHCWGGIGRTGTTVGCYLVRHGVSGRQALAQLAEWWQGVPKSRMWLYTPETNQQREYVLNWGRNSPSPLLNWHTRYTQQAIWTHELRKYLFNRTELTSAQRVLEVGCGTGAILSEIQAASLTCSGVQRKCHGLDIQPLSLMEARVHAPAASLTRGDALSLPYPNETFDITLCHFLLLWVSNPQGALAEMKRVTTQNGHVLALAEPDYTARVDTPAELEILGYWQAESLQKQGADPSLGGKLAEMFYQAGIELLETGAIERQRDGTLTSNEWEMEWAVLEADLAGLVPADEIQRLKIKDKLAWEQGKRTLHVPTYFAWGRV